MNKKVTWNDLVCSYSKNPRDVVTVPTTNRAGKWFFVSAVNGKIVVKNATAHAESSQIKGKRTLRSEELEAMLDLYHRRQKGEGVFAEAASTTVNQVYWYGIFSDLGL